LTELLAVPAGSVRQGGVEDGFAVLGEIEVLKIQERSPHGSKRRRDSHEALDIAVTSGEGVDDLAVLRRQ
jgi:hypothetical protein